MIPMAVYCERAGDGFWAEPLNAVSNVAFLIAAAWIARLAMRQAGGSSRSWDLWLLALLAASVGVGSFLWHTLRTPWSQWTDIIPIMLFINVFLGSFLGRVAGAGPATVAAGLVLYNLLNVGLQALLPRDFLNGSVFYLPTWLALLAIWWYVRRRGLHGAGALLTAVIAFSGSLVMRTIDRPLCAQFAYGTHFGWHLLNGLVLVAAVSALAPSPGVRRQRS